MKRRCSSATDTSRTQDINVTSPFIKGNHIGGLLTVCQWLGNMASHKDFNYTGLINTPLCEAKTSCMKKKLVWLWIKFIAWYWSVAMLLSHDFNNDKPDKRLVRASLASHSELLTRRTYYIQCIGPSVDLVRCSGTLNYPPKISTWTQTLPEIKSRNFILKRLLQYTELFQRLVGDLSSIRL